MVVCTRLRHEQIRSSDSYPLFKIRQLRGQQLSKFSQNNTHSIATYITTLHVLGTSVPVILNSIPMHLHNVCALQSISAFCQKHAAGSIFSCVKVHCRILFLNGLPIAVHSNTPPRTKRHDSQSTCVVVLIGP